MIKIKEIIIVEGKYDKQKLKKIVDGTIIETNGFRIFSDKQKQKLIINLAKKQGILILTDSDSAGFVIRSFLKSILPNNVIIKNVYAPQILGKEKRKNTASKEGFLGIEGIDEEILRKSLSNFINYDEKEGKKVTKTDFFIDGLTGRENSSELRLKMIKKFGLPEYMTTNALLEYVNVAMKYDEYKNIIANIHD